jgi:hypothetical protein
MHQAQAVYMYMHTGNICVHEQAVCVHAYRLYIYQGWVIRTFETSHTD